MAREFQNLYMRIGFWKGKKKATDNIKIKARCDEEIQKLENEKMAMIIKLNEPTAK